MKCTIDDCDGEQVEYEMCQKHADEVNAIMEGFDPYDDYKPLKDYPLAKS